VDSFRWRKRAPWARALALVISRQVSVGLGMGQCSETRPLYVGKIHRMGIKMIVK
jgi:hypothetical protein